MNEIMYLVDMPECESQDEGWWVQIPSTMQDPLEILIREEEEQLTIDND